MNNTEESLRVYKQISKLWEKAGLDFRIATLALNPEKNLPKDTLESIAVMKQQASEELQVP